MTLGPPRHDRQASSRGRDPNRRQEVGTTLFIVDAFAERPFKGNPAAVCLLREAQDDQWMQDVAMEMNLSETAFLCPEGDGYRLRWFTPKVEVDLCGHATLASAHILWETGYLRRTEDARFQTRSGLLTARSVEGWIELNFPAEPPEESTAPPELLRALKVQSKYLGQNRFDYLVEAESERAVRDLKPDFGLLASVTTRGVIVTSQSVSKQYDFVSRFFAPAVGINEDPVTGSAHSCLGPYWSGKLNLQEMLAYQASARGGILKVRTERNRVYISGRAVTVLRGELAFLPG
jgi:PhzF family phenazine biosynthesis protein